MIAKYLGAHISKDGTTLNTMKKITASGGNALQLFVSNPRSIQLANVSKFIEESKEILQYCKENNFSLVIHAPYTINLAKELKQGKRCLDYVDCYSVNLILNNLEVSDIINSVGVVFHVGKYTTLSKQDGLNNMYDAMKYIIRKMKEKHIKSKLIIETPAGAGTELLTKVQDFIGFYNSFSADEKKYMGICLDTAHIWSSGYNLNEYYNHICKTNAADIAVIHFNNSKKDKGSCVDVHETIPNGKIDIGDLKTFIKNLKHNPVIILEKPSHDINSDFVWIKAHLHGPNVFL